MDANSLVATLLLGTVSTLWIISFNVLVRLLVARMLGVRYTAAQELRHILLVVWTFKTVLCLRHCLSQTSIILPIAVSLLCKHLVHIHARKCHLIHPHSIQAAQQNGLEMSHTNNFSLYQSVHASTAACKTHANPGGNSRDHHQDECDPL